MVLERLSGRNTVVVMPTGTGLMARAAGHPPIAVAPTPPRVRKGSRGSRSWGRGGFLT